MKKITLILALVISFYLGNSQAVKITSAQSYLEYYFNKEGDINLEKAKADIDEAVANEKSTTMAKAWYVKGVIYQTIYEDSVIFKKFESVDILGDAYTAYEKAINLNDVRFRDQEPLYKRLNIVCYYIFNKGIDQFQTKKYAEGYQSFSKLEAANTFFESKAQKFSLPLNDIRNNAALCATQGGLTKEAIVLYENIVTKGTADAAVYSSLSTLYKTDGEADSRKLLYDGLLKFPTNVNLLIGNINYYLAERKYSEAIDLINKAIELDGKNDQLYVAAGLAYDKMNMVEKSRSMYLKATELNVKNLNARNNMGSSYVVKNDAIGKDLSALAGSLADSTNYKELSAKKEAIVLYENLVAKGTADAAVYYSLSVLYKINGEADSRKLLSDGLLKFPTNVNLLIGNINYFLAEDKYAEAIDLINKAIEVDEKNDQLYVAAGLAYDQMHNVEKSRSMYLKATELNVKNLNAWNNLGSSYVDEANAIFKEMNVLGSSAADSKKYEELNVKKVAAFTKAIPFIEKALSLDPANDQLKRKLTVLSQIK